MPLSLSKRQERALYPFAHQSILILGAGREGLSTYRFLRQAFPRKVIAVADQAPLVKWSTAWKEILDTDSNLRTYSGENYLDYLDKFQIIFKTPGIPPTLVQLQNWLGDPRHLLTSNTGLFFQLCPGKTIGVTGTKGKSTTASLIFHLLSRNGIKSVLLGNIGLPPLTLLPEITAKTVVVMELSSHQLQGLRVSPHIAVVQNIVSEHLDYYLNIKDYIEAKSSIAVWQKKSDFIIYNPDFPVPQDFARRSQATPLTFSLRDNDPQTVLFCRQQTVFYRDFSFSPPRLESVANLKLTKLKGTHNRQNISPAIIVAKLFHLSGEQINTALKSFSPLRHRLEWVSRIQQTDFYNDSLATNPWSMLAALQTFAKRPIVLLAGGFERHQDYTQVARYLLHHSHLVELILFPTTGARLQANILEEVDKFNQKITKNNTATGTNAAKQLLTPPIFHHVTNMPEAVSAAAQAAARHPNAVVLLSPGAASFDTFNDYADRGDQFVVAVKSLL